MNKRQLVWAYVIELLAAGILYYAAILWFGEPFLKFTEKLVEKIAIAGGVFLTITVAMWINCANTLRGQLGDYLNYKGADHAFNTSYAYQVILFIMVIVTGIFATLLPDVLKRCVFPLFIYAGINAWTVVVNTWWLMKLNQKLQTELRKYKDSTV